MTEDANAKPSPAEQVSRLYDELEAKGAEASEALVGGSGVAVMLGRLAENAAALTKLSGDAMDLFLRNLRIAGRRDVVGVARQLARTEDKLERVLQEVEKLRDELARAAPAPEGTPAAPATRAAPATPASSRSGRDGRASGRAGRAPAKRRQGSS